MRCHDKMATGTRCGTADIETWSWSPVPLLWGVGISSWGGRGLALPYCSSATLAHKEDLKLKEKDDVNKPVTVAFQVHNPAIFKRIRK